MSAVRTAPEPADAGTVPRPQVSVVMPTYQRRGLLATVLAPLLADPAAAEIVVVVDGCRDGSLELLQEAAARDPRLVPVWISNRGEGGARQAGVERATGEVVVLLDDDVEAAPGLISRHAQHHARGESDLVVVGYMPPSAPSGRDGFAVSLYAEAYDGRCRSYEADSEEVLRHLWAGNLSLRRTACLEVGLLNPSYRERYHPDREFGLRCLDAGLSGRFDRSCRATHHYSRTVAQFAADARSQGSGRVLMRRLHPALVDAAERDWCAEGLPRPAALVVRLCRRPRAGAAIAWSLRGVIRTAGLLRVRSAQLPAARLLRRVEQQRGACEALRGGGGQDAPA